MYIQRFWPCFWYCDMTSICFNSACGEHTVTVVVTALSASVTHIESTRLTPVKWHDVVSVQVEHRISYSPVVDITLPTELLTIVSFEHCFVPDLRVGDSLSLE